MDNLDEHVRKLMYNLMLAFYEQGITEIHVGGMMRILGVGNTIASEHDNETMILDDEFLDYVTEINTPRPPDQTLH